MERVQFQQEQMLAELKDLVQRGLFTETEVKQIMRKRTQFENALVRRVAKKADFLRYAAYEMNLEQLRRKRLDRLDLPKSKTTISDYALVRRQFHIFERALRKFKADVGLWIQYIQVAKRAGARGLVGRITARALQLHPNVPSLYVVAASHELSHASPSAARALLQRGLRLNAHSIDLWREYVRMELHFIEGMRRRWNILGISINSEKKLVDIDASMDTGMDDAADPIIITDDRGETPDEIVAAAKGGDQGEAARRAIMEGAIVKSAMCSAAKASPRIELFAQLDELIRNYPCEAHLRGTLLDELYDLLHQTIPDEPEAIKMFATRRLRELTLDKASVGSDPNQSESVRLIDALRDANERLVNAVGNPPNDKARAKISALYADFVEEWCRLPTLDAALKQYLIASLLTLARTPNALPVLQATHLRLLLRDGAPSKQILKLARRYCRVTNSPDVWLSRLDAEKAVNDGDITAIWSSARSAVQSFPDKSEVEKVWLWGLDRCTSPGRTQQSLFENLLEQSMQDSSTRSIHESLLLRYISDVVYSEYIDGVERCKLVRRLPVAYLPTKTVWEHLFSVESTRGDDVQKTLLNTIYQHWQVLDGVTAAMTWAGWLVDHGDGKEAMKIISKAAAHLTTEERARLQQMWNSRLNGRKGDREEREETSSAVEETVGGMPVTLTVE
ncbi:U3 small nucleolar RNA-associated protein 6-domain-containing protein [Pisolithus thermaeus]|nr:U3 small nucleolar RNA-associated protein 6-domain-containing protein [Pisolithus thermaeus]